MPAWFDRLTRREEKSTALKSLMAFHAPEASWSGRSFASLAIEGMARNPVVYRCVRLISESVARIPMVVEDERGRVSEHPALALLSEPNPRHSGADLIEQICLYLETAGDAYLEAGILDGEVKAIYPLRPDRVKMLAGADGWPRAYEYSAGGAARTIPLGSGSVARVCHIALMHPLDDHDGLSPLNAAQMALDIHNAASRWNKALLDNAARPSGALVYSAGGANLSEEQFRRLKEELEAGFQGALNAGRPMVLDGGLDWKPLAMSPKDMDFIQAKNAAAREIALAFGVPPMLLGIPGDNTYSNYVEANRSLWRQTVIPLANRIAAALTVWLQGAFDGKWRLVHELDQVEALASERALLWEQIGKADFLTEDEKRRKLGLGPRAGDQ